MEPANRRLIRPSLVEVKDQMNSSNRRVAPNPKKIVPPEQTNAENFYYLKQMQAKTPMMFVLQGNTDRIDDSSMPVLALNALPSYIASFLPDGALKSTATIASVPAPTGTLMLDGAMSSTGAA